MCSQFHDRNIYFSMFLMGQTIHFLSKAKLSIYWFSHLNFSTSTLALLILKLLFSPLPLGSLDISNNEKGVEVENMGVLIETPKFFWFGHRVFQHFKPKTNILLCLRSNFEPANTEFGHCVNPTSRQSPCPRVDLVIGPTILVRNTQILKAKYW